MIYTMISRGCFGMVYGFKLGCGLMADRHSLIRYGLLNEQQYKRL